MASAYRASGQRERQRRDQTCVGDMAEMGNNRSKSPQACDSSKVAIVWSGPGVCPEDPQSLNVIMPPATDDCSGAVLRRFSGGDGERLSVGGSVEHGCCVQPKGESASSSRKVWLQAAPASKSALGHVSARERPAASIHRAWVRGCPRSAWPRHRAVGCGARPTFARGSVAGQAEVGATATGATTVSGLVLSRPATI